MKFPAALEDQVFRALRAAPGEHLVFAEDEYKHGRVVIYRDNLAKTLHRYLWERTVAPIPRGRVLRRTCKEPRCVNPHHYELASRTRPLADRCVNGHRYTKANTTTDRHGVRHCLACRELANEKRRKGTHRVGYCRKAGHKLTPKNRYNDGRCRICKREYERERRANA